MADVNTLFARRVDVEPLGGDIDRQLAEVPDKPAVFLLADGEDRPILLATGLAVRTILRRRLGEPIHNAECAMPNAEQRSGHSVPNAEFEVSNSPPSPPPGAPLPGQGERKPAPSKRADLRPLVRRLYLHPTFSPFETDLWYLWLARQLFPDGYKRMVRTRHCWMLHDQSDGRVPRLAATDRFAPPGRRIGPIADRQSAARLVDLLSYLFELCHNYQVLRQAPHGRACEYKEMGRCSGPCDGTISLETYRGQVAAAANFAADRGRAWRAEQAERMKQAAARLDFELAARLKDRLARAGELDSPRYRWLADMNLCNFLIVQPGQAKPQLRTFRTFAGRIVAGPTLKRSDPSAGLAEWLKLAPPPEDPQLQAEEAGLLADYLFGGDGIVGGDFAAGVGKPGESPADGPAAGRRRGLFIRYVGQPPAELAAGVAAAFAPTARGKPGPAAG